MNMDNRETHTFVKDLSAFGEIGRQRHFGLDILFFISNSANIQQDLYYNVREILGSA